jgi:hypothetical protein
MRKNAAEKPRDRQIEREKNVKKAERSERSR